MSKHKHTAGPWGDIHVIDGLTMGISYNASAGDERDYYLAKVTCGDPDELMANARMIKAAPTLFSALVELQANPNDPRAHRQALDAMFEAVLGARS